MVALAVFFAGSAFAKSRSDIWGLTELLRDSPVLAEVEVVSISSDDREPFGDRSAEMRVLHVYRGRLDSDQVRVPFVTYPIGACPRHAPDFVAGTRLLIGLATRARTPESLDALAVPNRWSYRKLKDAGDPKRVRACIAELVSAVWPADADAQAARHELNARLSDFARQDLNTKELLLRAAMEGILSPSDADVLAAADWVIGAVAPSRSRLCDDLCGLTFALLRERGLAAKRLRQIVALSDHPAFVVRQNARSAIHRFAQESGLPYDSQVGVWDQVDGVLALLDAAEAG